MQHKRLTMLIVLLSVLLGAGCSTAVAGQAAPAPGAAPGGDSAPGDGTAPVSAAGVAWVDQVCGVFLDANRTLQDQPTPDMANAAGTLDGYKQYFARSVPALDTAVTQFAAIGPGPLEGGDQLIGSMVGLATVLRDAYSNAQASVNAIDPASPTVLTQDLPAAIAMTNVRDVAPEIDIAATPELNAAAAAAPNCQAISD
jgi:hypothetical protein